MTIPIDSQLENYVLETEIGQGNFTTAYRAHRRTDNAVVAIKIAHPNDTADTDYARRFREFAQQAAKLEHPNIARTYEANQDENALYMVREFIDARSLAQVIRETGPFPLDRMLIVAKQIAAALDYAHQKSITHGDLSANRVYIGLNDHTTVADFGQTQAIAGTTLIQPGTAVGSPEIMAPERIKGQSPSRQSDLYALGILCYQMLAGEPPFQGSREAVLEAQAQEQPRPLHVVNPNIPVALSETISRMLAKGLELRYNTGAEFTRAMEMAIQGSAPMRSRAVAAAQIKAAGFNTTPWWRRAWALAVIGIVVVGFLLVFGFGIVSLWTTFGPTVAVAPTPNEIEVAPSPTFTPLPVENQEPTGSSSNVVLVTTEPGEASPPDALPPDLTATPLPTATPTLIPLPTPGPPTIAEGSPFTNLVVAHALSDDEQPEKVGTSFAPGSQPIYLFFDYEGIEAGTTWTHRWRWGDTELDAFEDVWPERYSPSGTAWVFFSPAGGFQPGPYQVTLEINGSTVATATFVVQPGGL